MLRKHKIDETEDSAKEETKEEERKTKPKRTHWSEEQLGAIRGLLVAKKGCVGSVCSTFSEQHPSVSKEHSRDSIRQKVNSLKKKMVKSGELVEPNRCPPFSAPNKIFNEQVNEDNDDDDDDNGDDDDGDNDDDDDVGDIRESEHRGEERAVESRTFHHEVHPLAPWSINEPNYIITVWPVPKNENYDITFSVSQTTITINIIVKIPTADKCKKMKEALGLEEVPKFENPLVYSGIYHCPLGVHLVEDSAQRYHFEDNTFIVKVKKHHGDKTLPQEADIEIQ